MTASTQHPLAAEWLERLRTASAALPASEQADLLADIEAHLAESIPADATEAEVRDALDRMGDPEEIVAEAQGSPLPVAPRRGTLEWVAIVLLLAGGLLFVLGWFVGVALLWASRAWTVRDKLIGTFVVPGGLAAFFFPLLWGLTGASEVCVGGAGQKTVCRGGLSATETAVFFVSLFATLVLPMITAVYLARRADRPRPA